jgi:hypothetical protein
MSTGLNCHFYERADGTWYYLLEDWGSPKGGWDWREYATMYGPFPSEERADDHLRRHHANPGSSSAYRRGGYKEDAVLTDHFLRAPANKRRLSGG